LRLASLAARLVAAAIDLVIVALLVIALIEGGLTLLSDPPFAAIWRAPALLQAIVEPAGEPTVEKLEGGLTRRSAASRETRVFADGTVRIYAVLDARVVAADGSVHEGRAETLVGENRSAIRRRWSTVALALLLPVLWFGAFEASTLQATPGKLLAGLRVVDLHGGRIGKGQALARQALKLLEIATSLVTFFIAALTPRRQALHDMFAGTLVVRRDSP
jgi:uncharacterized RDD family membrane protein YckC